MKIQNIQTIVGPNIYHRKSVMVMTLDLGYYAEISSEKIEGFIPALLEMLPGLHSHRCSPGYEGGFVERLHRGTYFGHIIEHIALELSTLAGIEVGYGKTIYGGREGVYKIIIRYKSEKGMKQLLHIATDIAKALAEHKPFPHFEIEMKKVKEIVAAEAFGPSTQSIIDAAIRRNIPWKRLNDSSLIQLGYGKKRKFIQATTTEQTSYISVELAQDKNLTKQLLENAGIKVPKGFVVRSEQEALQALEDFGGAVAVKPLDAQQGRGITLNVTTPEQIKKAFSFAQKIRSSILVEQYLRGKDYRVLVVNQKVVAASQRLPPTVVGDNQLSIEQLIEKENLNPLRGSGHEMPMTMIKIDEALRNFLNRKGLTLEDIPAKGESIVLRETANLSTGGYAIDVTDEIHPDIRLLCERAAAAIALDVCGVDLIAEDISKSLDQELGIIELNASPGLRMHIFPSMGKPRDVGSAILATVFPEEEPVRIPVIAITGTNGKTTVSRLTSFILSKLGTVGFTSSDGIYIGSQKVMSGDTSGPTSAQVVLNDPAVDIAVLETARGGIVRRGLGFDQCDVAVITNIAEDHIGQDGIETLEDILRIKSLIVDCLSPQGILILNAEDALLADMARAQIEKRGREAVILFSTDKNNPLIKEHQRAGGIALFTDGLWIYYSRDGIAKSFAKVADIPLTLGGLAKFQVENVMASVATALAQNMNVYAIKQALFEFHAIHHNNGRVNLFKLPKGYLIIDYGHNPAAFTAISGMAQHWPRRVTGVVGVPGDRNDELIRKSLEIAAQNFDKIVARDDHDLRGRKPSEIPLLLKSIVNKVDPKKPFKIVLDEEKAVETAIQEMQDDELIIVFFDEKEKMQKILKKYQAVATESFNIPTPHVPTFGLPTAHFGTSSLLPSESMLPH
ncbi:MAG: cyanophycin synthetase [Bdellovibrionales bacterium]